MTNSHIIITLVLILFILYSLKVFFYFEFRKSQKINSDNLLIRLTTLYYGLTPLPIISSSNSDNVKKANKLVVVFWLILVVTFVLSIRFN